MVNYLAAPWQQVEDMLENGASLAQVERLINGTLLSSQERNELKLWAWSWMQAHPVVHPSPRRLAVLTGEI